MALTLNGYSRIPSTPLTTTTDNPATDLYLCVTGTKLLVLCVGTVPYATSRTGGNPTYDGVELTQIGTRVGITETGIEFFYLINPTAGYLSISIPNGNGQALWAYAASVSVDSGHSIALDSYATETDTSQRPYTSAITTKAATTLVFGAVATGDDTFAPTDRTGTSIYEEDLGTYGSGFQYYLNTIAGSFLGLEWVDTTVDDWGSIIAAFSEALAISKSQNISVTDILDVKFPFEGKSTSDSISVSESSTVIHVFLFETSDSISITEATTAAVTDPAVVASETVTLTDITGMLEPELVSDTVTVTDAVRYYPDEIIVVDRPFISIQSAQTIIVVTDNIYLYETTLGVGSLTVVQLDVVGVSDIASLELVETNTVSESESITVTDTPIADIATTREATTSDSITVTDTPDIIVVDANVLAISTMEFPYTPHSKVFDIPTVAVVAVTPNAVTTSDSITVTTTPTVLVPDAVEVYTSTYVSLSEFYTLSGATAEPPYETVNFTVYIDQSVPYTVYVDKAVQHTVYVDKLISDGIEIT